MVKVRAPERSLPVILLGSKDGCTFALPLEDLEVDILRNELENDGKPLVYGPMLGCIEQLGASLQSVKIDEPLGVRFSGSLVLQKDECLVEVTVPAVCAVACAVLRSVPIYAPGKLLDEIGVDKGFYRFTSLKP